MKFSGMVNKPGRIDLPINQEFRILDAVSVAHGVSYKVLDRVMVCRAIPGKAERAVIDAHAAAHGATRDQLLPLLHAVNDRVGWISPGAVSHLDTFEYKPDLVKYHDQPLPGGGKVVTFQGGNGNLMRSPWGWSRHGQPKRPGKWWSYAR